MDMLGVECGNTNADMSVQYMTKGDPPSYAPRLTHDYLQPNATAADQGQHPSLENKVQQHSINDILSSSNKQGM